MRRRFVRLCALAVVSVLALAACGGSKYRYVSNANQLLYFKVPKHWGYFPFTKSDEEGRIQGVANPTRVWHVGFDGADQPDAAHLSGEAVPEAPVGEIEVWALSDDTSERTSSVAARVQAFSRFGIDFDPVNPPEQVAAELTGRYELVDFKRGVTRSGVQISRAIINIKRSSDGVWVTIDGSSYYDALTHRVYTLTQWCTAACYKASLNTFNEIATSWKVNR